MFCQHCGASVGVGAGFCAACGTPVGGVAAGPPILERPGLVTLLAVLQFLGGAFWLLAALLWFAGGEASAELPIAASAGAGFLAVVGLLQLVCGYGLWKLKSHGRMLQLAFAWIGLLAIPIGTIIAVLILIYLFKPGIKLLFSERPPSDFTPEEISQVNTTTSMKPATVVLIGLGLIVLVVGGISIVAAIAVPGLLRARIAGNEVSAIGSLRAIASAQAAYASSCAAGSYAVALDDLALPPAGTDIPFISPDLSANGAVKSGYSISVMRSLHPTAVSTMPASTTCNGSGNDPMTAYVAYAEPVTPGSTGLRYFALDESGTLVESLSPIGNPIVLSDRVHVVR